MTRKSKRSVESALDDLTAGRPDSAREWVKAEAHRRVVEGDGDVGLLCEHDGPEYGDTVIYVSADGHEFGHPREEIPDWIDIEEDLPVQGDPNTCNPFVVADFTGGTA